MSLCTIPGAHGTCHGEDGDTIDAGQATSAAEAPAATAVITFLAVDPPSRQEIITEVESPKVGGKVGDKKKLLLEIVGWRKWYADRLESMSMGLKASFESRVTTAAAVYKMLAKNLAETLYEIFVVFEMFRSQASVAMSREARDRFVVLDELVALARTSADGKRKAGV